MEDFKWTDELVEQFAEEYRFSSSRISLDQFKQSKQPKPKDYEVLSFKYKDLTWVLNGELFYNEFGGFTGMPDKAEIRSVKRLSDGEVFTCGDKMYYNGNKFGSWKKESPCNVDSFSLSFGNIFINSHYTGTPNCRIEDWIKVKEPLFTTEDGVNIIEGKHFWYVGDAFNICETRLLKNENWPIRLQKKSFSTIEAAENWVLNNKVLFSLNDISKVIKRETMTFHELETLAKSKFKI